jgi:hypothetical protein
LANDPIGARGGGQAVGHRGAGIPKVNPRFAERNVAMQVIDKLLGANVVPATFMAQHAGKQGFIMEKVKGKTGRELGAGKLPEEKQFATDAMANPLVREGLSKIYLLDLICAQVDRHPGNYMVVIEEGVIKGVKAIDNDLAFGKDVDIDALMQMQGGLKQWRRMGFIGPLADELKEIDKNFAQKIIDLSKTPDVLRNALQGLLTPEEIEKTVDRLNSLALFLQPLLTQNSPIVKTKWE